MKFKGKGHEVSDRGPICDARRSIQLTVTKFSDAAKLLSFYQLWLDDLFPKARFLDALSMVEKAGHKKFMHMKRVEWINEGKPGASRPDGDDIFGGGGEEERAAAVFPAPLAPVFQSRGSERPKTPSGDVPDDDEDLYDATPKASRPSAPAGQSLFGSGGDDAPDDDDLDALMAEEEAQRPASTSLFGSGGAVSSRPAQKAIPEDEDEDDLDALMAEHDSGPSLPVRQAPKGSKKPSNEEEDDLDALMAESEAQVSRPGKQAKTSTTEADADEEAAMAEMDGLW